MKSELENFFVLKKKILESVGHIGNLPAYGAEKYSERIAIIYGDQRITFLQLYKEIVRFSAFLQEHGVKKDDIVCICLGNSPDFYYAYYGVLHLGAIIAPINTLLAEHELQHIVSDAVPTVVICMEEKKTYFQHLGVLVYTPEMIMMQQGYLPIEIHRISDGNNRSLCALLYTSGTTGVPKGVMLSSHSILTNIAQMIVRLNITPCFEHRVLGVLPLFHIFAQSTCVWAPFFLGATIILVEKVDRKLIAKALEHKPTIVLGVPPLYGLFCLMKNADFSLVEWFISGADAMSDRIRMAFALLYGRKIANGYGLTEASPVVAFDAQDRLVSGAHIGLPLPGITVILCDDKGDEVPPGSIGELVVSGETVMLGYYHADEQTDKVLKNGSLYTGDLAIKSKDDNYIIVGRIKDTIKHKGVNIYPLEIEQVIMQYDQVVRVAVVGKQVPEFGEVPIAFVQLKSMELNIDDILTKFCQNYLALYKIPKRFICTLDSLPLTAAGKVNKKKLREQVDTY